jgi:hypothetical protein
LAGCGILGKDGIKIGRIPDRTDDQLVHFRSGTGAYEGDVDSQKDEKEDGRDE